MITLRRSADRHHIQRRKQEIWLSFYALDRNDPLADGYATLQALNEEWLAPGADGKPLSPTDAEVVTYVLEGALAYEDSAGGSGVILAGEFQRRTEGRGARHSEANASRTERAHAFHLMLRPSQAEREASREQKRFSAAERRGALRVVASPDGRGESLRVGADCRIYSSILDPGQHLVHELSAPRSAWLHVVRGEAILGDLVLSAGDGAGVTAERAVSLTAREDSEILLVDLNAAPMPRALETAEGS